jgi:glyoxylase-like metal-dependent hydrolase (beta-lactamase superfamily II)
VLVDCGPASTIPALEAGLRVAGLELADLRHLLLTHIHLDHAGAAGSLVRRVPGLQVWVSEAGAPHIVDPAKLERSARRLWADFDALWGELLPVPEANVRVFGDRALGLEVFPSPGHASHHVTLVGSDGSCYPGDTTGARIVPATLIAPTTPPPDVDPEGWAHSLDEIERRRPERLCLPHFGIVENAAEHLGRWHEQLVRWVERVGAGESEEEFVETIEAELTTGLDVGTAAAYRWAAPAWMSYAGLRRYWDKREEEGVR